MIAQVFFFPQQKRNGGPRRRNPPRLGPERNIGSTKVTAQARRTYFTRTVPSPNKASMAANNARDGLTRYRSDSAIARRVRS